MMNRPLISFVLCAACHTGSGSIMFEDGVDISPVSEWRSTMMANAATDPIWRAAVSAEVVEHPQLQSVIENKCTRCHGPLAHAEAEFAGELPYSMADLIANELALDGVSCTLCHQVDEVNFGQDDSVSLG